MNVYRNALTFFLALILTSTAFESAAQRPGARRPKRQSEAEVKAKPGGVAPDFSLKTADGKQTVTLSSFRGRRPVALIFGSYT